MNDGAMLKEGELGSEGKGNTDAVVKEGVLPAPLLQWVSHSTHKGLSFSLLLNATRAEAPSPLLNATNTKAPTRLLNILRAEDLDLKILFDYVKRSTVRIFFKSLDP